jgi:hypothetical protein
MALFLTPVGACETRAYICDIRLEIKDERNSLGGFCFTHSSVCRHFQCWRPLCDLARRLARVELGAKSNVSDDASRADFTHRSRGNFGACLPTHRAGGLAARNRQRAGLYRALDSFVAVLGSAIVGIYRGVFKVCSAGGGDLETGAARNDPHYETLVLAWLLRHLWLLMPAKIRA